MHWNKIGQIFDPSDHSVLGQQLEFAQSPQTLILEDRVRVYFSTRSRSRSRYGDGKFLSHIAFVDFSRDFSQILGVSQEQVIPLGDLGCFDEHGIFPINVLSRSGEIFAYTCGWNRRVSVSVDTAIGLAKSYDGGRTFQKVGAGPVLGPSLNEPFLVGDGFVRFFKNQFHMWYIFGTSWAELEAGCAPDRTYKIGHATSTDGVNWKKEDGVQIVSDRLPERESQALPSVVEVGYRYLMAFCYRYSSDFRSNPERAYRLGFAWSDDLMEWSRADDQFRFSGTTGCWDADMQCYPHVFELNGKTFLLYNGNEFGRHGFGLAELIH
ncbi:MAG: hypothetical protein H6981_04195 [Gammaproteobacteria bacterium]|nr:hypothetical protein [Gammaproteobacteria bacterium]MCP5135982.1 hypothetical protein [Gammaproteobacteria bacterium]